MDPGFINIQKGGYCRDCPFINLVSTVYNSYAGEVVTATVCRNHDICDRVYHVTIDSLKEMKSF